jgi:hypothetical protein
LIAVAFTFSVCILQGPFPMIFGTFFFEEFLGEWEICKASNAKVFVLRNFHCEWNIWVSLGLPPSKGHRTEHQFLAKSDSLHMRSDLSKVGTAKLEVVKVRCAVTKIYGQG